MQKNIYRNFSCTLYPSGLMFAEFNKDLKVDLEIAKEMVHNRIEFMQNEAHYLAVDLSNVKEVTPEAKEYLQHPDGGLKNILGAAFIANNLPAELLAKIYVKTEGGFPAKFFQRKKMPYSGLKT